MALWIVGTPIGTLGDASPRSREILGAAAVIACEDTRTTRKLLTALEVSAPPLEALHAHNEGERAEALAARARTEDVVLVSDAGMPGVSDPGHLLVAAALRGGVEIRSVPGPSALATALAVSGFPAAPSAFLGFPPRKGRDGWCADALARPEVLVVYEAPGRVPDLLRRLAAVDGEREAVVCRELSKKFEEVRRDTLLGLATHHASEPLRGECVVVVGPGQGAAVKAVEPALDLSDGAGLKQIAEALAVHWQARKRDVYQALLALQDELDQRPR